jgi:hypothetical protein
MRGQKNGEERNMEERKMNSDNSDLLYLLFSNFPFSNLPAAHPPNERAGNLGAFGSLR